MRRLRSFFNWGLCPQTPAIYRCSRQNSCAASQIRVAPPNPHRAIADGRRVRRLPAIPAAESALRLRRRRALSSAQVLPEWTTITTSCNNFAANGSQCLNFMSHSRGSLHPRPCSSGFLPLPNRLRLPPSPAHCCRRFLGHTAFGCASDTLRQSDYWQSFARHFARAYRSAYSSATRRPCQSS